VTLNAHNLSRQWFLIDSPDKAQFLDSYTPDALFVQTRIQRNTYMIHKIMDYIYTDTMLATLQ